MFSCRQSNGLICRLVGLKDLVEKHFRGLLKRWRGPPPPPLFLLKDSGLVMGIHPRCIRHVTQRSNCISSLVCGCRVTPQARACPASSRGYFTFHRSEYLCMAIRLECRAVWGCHTLNISAKKSPLSSFNGPKRHSASDRAGDQSKNWEL